MKNRKVFNFTGHEINYREFTIPSHGNIRVEERVSLGEPANSSEFPSLRPTIYLVGDIGDVLRVVQPIELTWAVDEFRQNVISDDVSFMYGVGDTVELAMADYKASLIDYYLTLSSRQDAPTRKLFDRLCKYILFRKKGSE